MGLKEQKIEDIRKQLGDIIENIEQSALQKVKLHELELNMLRSLLELGLTLLSYYIFTVSQLVKLEGIPKDSEGHQMKNSGNHTRPYRSTVSYTHLTLPTICSV